MGKRITTLLVLLLFSLGANAAVNYVTVSGKEGIYTYVDLGLPSGTKWATYNVGATKPTEYGDYFAWGETKAKEKYSRATYKWCENKKVNDSGIPQDFTKYCSKFSYGTVDYKEELDAEDDAATANWGSAWRMPTEEELEELIDGCEWKWVNDFNGSGVNGRLGTSKSNGSTIFLPAAGCRYGTGLDCAGNYGFYWSSSLCKINSSYASFLYFYDYSIDWLDDGSIYLGQSVRAVLR